MWLCRLAILFGHEPGALRREVGRERALKALDWSALSGSPGLALQSASNISARLIVES